MEAMQKQAEKFGAQIILNDVVSVDFKDDLKTVTTDDGETYTANAVIISTGSQVRKLGVPGEQEYSGRGVSYCATCDGFFFRGKPIVVVGGGDSAFEEALFLTRFGSSVTLIHRRDSFRASKIMIDRARKNEKIKFVLNSVVQSINGSNEDAQSVTVKNVVTGETQDIEASGIFVAIGHLPSTSFLNNSIALNEDGTISVQGASTKTSIPGVFAAGDVVDSVYRQAISAAGMGCRAALDAQAYLNDLSE